MQYISVEHQKAISERYKVASITVIAFCVTVVAIIIIARFIEPPEIVPGSERLTAIVPVVVIIMAMAAIILRRVWMSAMVLRVAVRAGVNEVLNRLMQMTVICAALSEMVAVVGLMFYILTANYRYGLILNLVSLMLLFYTAFPRRGEWERAVVAAANARA
ncbi:MAG TPA: hypothetical protein VKE91_07185 [Blastocatellia bacterium]|nr:hypothetical protein [Blastocatellia bacterium]